MTGVSGGCNWRAYKPNERMTATMQGHSDLQQSSQERYVVGPFLLRRVPYCERALHARGITAIALVLLLQSYSSFSQPMRAESGVLFRCIPSSALPRVTLGEGDVRPEPVGENICRLAERS
jgi:hypothetical protein